MSSKGDSPLFLLAIAILLWSTQAVVTKELVVGIGALNATFYMFLFAAVGSGAMVLLKGKSGELKRYSPYDLKVLLFIAGLWAIGSILYYYTFGTLTSAEAISVRYLWPVFVVGLSIAVLRERVSLAQWLSLGLGFGAVYILVGGGSLIPLSYTNVLPALLVVASAGLWALYLLYQKKHGYEVFSSTFILSVMALAIVTVFLFLESSPVLPAFPLLVMSAYFGIMTVAVGNAIYTSAFTRANTGFVSVLSYVTPFIALVWSSSILGEVIYPHYFVGLALVVAAALLGTPRSNKITSKYIKY